MKDYIKSPSAELHARIDDRNESIFVENANRKRAMKPSTMTTRFAEEHASRASKAAPLRLKVKQPQGSVEALQKQS